MSRPPASSAFPTLGRNTPQIPPFPQLLHLKDEALPYRPSSVSEEYHSEDELESVGSPGAANGGGTSKRDGKDKDKGSQGDSRKPHATRRRVVQSCSECRRRKIKCDKKFPCGMSHIFAADPHKGMSTHVQDHAFYARTKHGVMKSGCAKLTRQAEKTVVSNSSNYATTSDLAALAHRLDALESSLVKTGALLPADLERYLKSTRDQMAGFQATPTYAVPVPPKEAPPLAEEETVDDTEGAALTLEHLAFGRSRVDGGHALPHFGARYPSTVGRSAPNHSYHLAKSAINQSPLGMNISPGSRDVTLRHGQGHGGGLNYTGHGLSPLSQDERTRHIDQLLDLMGPTDVFDLFYRKTDVVMKALAKVLPTKEKGEILVKAYLDRVDWLHRCLHIPTFLRSCGDLWALSPDQVVSEISLPFIALYLTVCMLGMQFMDSSEVNKHFTLDEAHTLPDLWYNSARSALWAADFMANHTMEAIQCVILMMVFMNNRDRADAAWALLGTVVKMAQGLGMSRLGAEQQSQDGKPLPMWTGRWESLIQREVGRRIWWNLVFLDWVLAPSYNYCTSIQADQIKTAPPANIDDEDIIDGQQLRPKPIHVRTSISFQLARLKFAEIAHRQIWQANNNNHPPYSFILSVDGDFRKAMMELPAFFQPDPNTQGPPRDNPKALVHYYEKIMLNLAIHSRMLRLHRPWLSRGYEDERFAYSKEQCIRAARASLRMMGSDNASAAFIEKWWIPLFYVSVSGLVVIIDLLKTPRRHMHNSETEQKIREVKGALDQMRRIADISHPSRAAVKVMDFLMAEVEERRRPNSSLGKRKADGSPSVDGDESSELQRAVKKLIRQAALEADSPNQSMGSNNTPTPGNSGPSGWSPAKNGSGVDMRIFSDTPRDRPVFDAYPMPPSAPEIKPDNNGLQAPQANYGGNSPFTFPVDPTNAIFPPFDPRAYGQAQQPQLDPAVESILTSYFPQPQTQGNTVGSAVVPQVPDDFLSKVFNFGWDNGQGGQMGQQGQGPQQHQQQQQPGQQQQQGQQGQGGMLGAPGGGLLEGFAQGGGGGMFDGWGAHGWMA